MYANRFYQVMEKLNLIFLEITNEATGTNIRFSTKKLLGTEGVVQ